MASSPKEIFLEESTSSCRFQLHDDNKANANVLASSVRNNLDEDNRIARSRFDGSNDSEARARS